MSDVGQSIPKVQSIFAQAVENVPPQQWSDFLDKACGDDDALRHQVQRLLEAHADDPALIEFREFIDNLNEDEQASLVAIMWIGRDTFTADDLDEAIETAKAEAINSTADYLLGVPLLSDYLESGLEALGIDPTEEEDELY